MASMRATVRRRPYCRSSLLSRSAAVCSSSSTNFASLSPFRARLKASFDARQRPSDAPPSRPPLAAPAGPSPCSAPSCSGVATSGSFPSHPVRVWSALESCLRKVSTLTRIDCDRRRVGASDMTNPRVGALPGEANAHAAAVAAAAAAAASASCLLFGSARLRLFSCFPRQLHWYNRSSAELFDDVKW